MADKTDTRTKEVVTADVVRYGEKIIVPERPTPMPYRTAAEILVRRSDYEEQAIEIYEDIPVFPWEGALALKKAIEEKFGFFFANTQTIESFFGSYTVKPKEITVQIGVDEFTTAPWGEFSLPGIDAREGTNDLNVVYTQTHAGKFRMFFTVQRKYEHLARDLANRTRKIAIEQSIYRGKAVRINFGDDDNDVGMPEPQFMDLSKSDLTSLIYSRDLEDRIETELFTPIRHTDALRSLRIPLKRGILASGPYGCGKTLLADKTAVEAVANRWTFIYLQDVKHLASAIRFAKMYEPAIIFAEDIDRVVSGERSSQMDAVLNTIDGIDSKHSEIMVVLTTNHLEKIHDAMLRPGRLDVILPITPPDAEAVQRLLQVYGRGLIGGQENLMEIGIILNGEIPAVIREVVERAKLGAIRRTGSGDNLILSAEDLKVAAQTVVAQRDLCKPAPIPPSPIEKLGISIGTAISEGQQNVLRHIAGLPEGTDPISSVLRGQASPAMPRAAREVLKREADALAL